MRTQLVLLFISCLLWMGMSGSCNKQVVAALQSENEIYRQEHENCLERQDRILTENASLRRQVEEQQRVLAELRSENDKLGGEANALRNENRDLKIKMSSLIKSTPADVFR